MSNVRGALYAKVSAGQTLNLADLLLDNYGNVNKSVDRIIVDCDTSGGGGPVNITLPPIADLGPATNFNVVVRDRAGNAAVQNIIITRGGTTDKINASTTTTINSNYMSAFFVVGTVNTVSGWACFNLSTINAYRQANEQGVLNGANKFQTANFPISNKQHVIVADGNGKVLTVTTNYTIDYATGLITLLAPYVAGDPMNVFYSY